METKNDWGNMRCIISCPQALHLKQSASHPELEDELHFVCISPSPVWSKLYAHPRFHVALFS